MSKSFVGSRISTCFPSRQRHQAIFSSLSTVFTTNCQKSSDAQRVNKYIYKREQIIFLVNIYNASNMEVFNSSLNLQWIWDKTDETIISALLLEATHRIQRKNVIRRIMPLQQLNWLKEFRTPRVVSTRHFTAKSAVFLRPYKAARTEGKTHKSSDLTVTVVEKLFEFQPSPRVANSRNR